MARFIDLLVRENMLRPASFQDQAVIVGDEQLAYIDSLPDDNPPWRARDFPNCAPPFERFWIEARSGVADVDLGFFFHVSQHLGGVDPAVVYRKWWGKSKEKIKWTLSAFCCIRKGKIIGNLPQNLVLFIAADGHILNPEDPNTGRLLIGGGPYMPWLIPTSKFHATLTTEHGLNTIAFALRTLAMLNCVNVELEPHAPPPALSKSHAKKYKVPMSSWYELRVKTKRYAQAEAATERDETGERRHNREHMVRGHFKQRKTGLYWWNSFVRGQHDLGTIRKSYMVEG